MFETLTADPLLFLQIHASSVNPVDWKLQTGSLKLLIRLVLPVVPGDLSPPTSLNICLAERSIIQRSSSIRLGGDVPWMRFWVGLLVSLLLGKESESCCSFSRHGLDMMHICQRTCRPTSELKLGLLFNCLCRHRLRWNSGGGWLRYS